MERPPSPTCKINVVKSWWLATLDDQRCSSRCGGVPVQKRIGKRRETRTNMVARMSVDVKDAVNRDRVLIKAFVGF